MDIMRRGGSGPGLCMICRRIRMWVWNRMTITRWWGHDVLWCYVMLNYECLISRWWTKRLGECQADCGSFLGSARELTWSNIHREKFRRAPSHVINELGSIYLLLMMLGLWASCISGAMIEECVVSQFSATLRRVRGLIDVRHRLNWSQYSK